MDIELFDKETLKNMISQCQEQIDDAFDRSEKIINFVIEIIGTGNIDNEDLELKIKGSDICTIVAKDKKGPGELIEIESLKIQRGTYEILINNKFPMTKSNVSDCIEFVLKYNNMR